METGLPVDGGNPSCHAARTGASPLKNSRGNSPPYCSVPNRAPSREYLLGSWWIVHRLTKKWLRTCEWAPLWSDPCEHLVGGVVPIVLHRLKLVPSLAKSCLMNNPLNPLPVLAPRLRYRLPILIKTPDVLELGNSLVSLEYIKPADADKVSLALLTSLCRAQLFGIRWEHIYWQQAPLALPTIKRHRARVLPFPPEGLAIHRRH